MLNVGIIGYGYWGPNILRNFSSIKGVKVRTVCDKNRKALQRAEKVCRDLQLFTDHQDMLKSSDIDVIAIVTSVGTHFELAKRSLENGKHVFVEKPFTSSVKEAEELIRIADRKKLKIMVDHTFLFTSSVRKIKEIVDHNVLGKLYYYDSTRVNLGLFQHDVNVIWDLAPHDLSIMDYVISEKPVAIVATGVGHFNRGLENIAYITVYFKGNMMAHFNVNWMSPVKVRTTLIGGEKKMLVWNDLEPDEKIRIYDKGVKIKNAEGVYNLLVEYRSGDMWAPRVEHTEALAVELEYFVQCILKDKAPINDGRAGLRIIKMLEATDRSLRGGGKQIKL